MDVESLAKELILKNMTPEQQMAVLDSVRQSVIQAKEVQKKKIGENVDLVVQALKKIESDITTRFESVGNSIEKRVLSIKDGRDGSNGKDGRDGKDGKNGRDGAKGEKGESGQDGIDGVDGNDGVSVTNAHIDFDGSLVITLSTGVEINVGEVVSADVAEKIKVISTMSTNAAIAVKEEGTTITSGVKSLNFVGTGITATTSGDDVTVTVASGSGTVTSVAATGGTGISVSGSPITTSGTLTITNTAPDQTVALTQGGTTTITGTYPNFTISSADQFQGTVTSVTGTSPVASSGGATPAISLAASYGDTQNPYASKTANYVLAAPNGSSGAPTFRAIVASDIPTLNQSTTGSAATLTTARAIYGNNFDGSAALTQIIASTYGGTGNGFTKFTGAATAEKTYTLPNSNATLLYDGGALGTPASGTVTNLTGTASININGTVGATTANTGSFTTLSASSTVSGTGFSTYLASPPAIGGTTAAAGTFTTVTANTSVTTPIVTSAAATALTLKSAGTTAVTIDTSQNVLVGSTSNPFNSKLYITGTPTANAPIFSAYTQGASNVSGIGLYNDAASVGIWSSSGNLTFRTNGNLASGIETMRIDSSGILMVGKTAASNTSKGAFISQEGQLNIVITNAGGGSQCIFLNRQDATGDAILFRQANNTVGSISVTGSATAYNTSSDYRLKNTIAPMTGALAKVALLKPCTYKWNVDGSNGQGFIAHELQEVVEGCVTGEKDAVDADGNPKYQGIDTSFLVATLTAAIQEQQALITKLTARITALEAK